MQEDISDDISSSGNESCYQESNGESSDDEKSHLECDENLAKAHRRGKTR